jgi:hypothetical protein
MAPVTRPAPCLPIMILMLATSHREPRPRRRDARARLFETQFAPVEYLKT